MLELTPIGWILMPVGLGLFLFEPEYLYTMAIFFLPFSATALVNVDLSGSFSGIQATMFFGALWMIRALVDFSRAPQSQCKQQLRVPNVQLSIFVLVVLISLVMPIWINGSLSIESPILADPGSTPLHLTFRHFTQTMYLVYGVLFTILIGFKNSDMRHCVSSIRTFLISAIFVSCWGLFQLICFWLDIEYPSFIFNTNKSDYALGYLQEIQDVGLKRISSVATEPSIFSACMLIALVFGLYAIISKNPVISKNWDRIAVCTIGLALLLSTSTTAYLGLAVAGLIYIVSLRYLRLFRRVHLFPLAILFGILATAFVVFLPVQDLLSSIVVEKAASASGIEAITGYILAFHYFLLYPLLGVGWGTVTSRDLVLKLLANTGIVGFFVFSAFIVTTMVRLVRVVRHVNHNNPTIKWCSVSLFATFLVLLFVITTSGFEYVYGQIWFVFGLAIAVPAMIYPRNGFVELRESIGPGHNLQS